MTPLLQHLLPEQFSITAIKMGSKTLDCLVVSKGAAAPCPLCGQQSVSVHSFYVRTVFDLPIMGKTMRLRIQARKFFCRNPACQRKVFCERLKDVVEAYGRKTLRFFNVLQGLSLQMSAEMASRVSQSYGTFCSPDCLLRYARKYVPEAISSPNIGLDDWAKRKGIWYGSILVDLDSHRVVDLINSRETHEVKLWFDQHPEVKLVARDRGKNFMDVTSSYPVKVVLDRWHLMKNLTEALEHSVKHHYQHLRGHLPANQARRTVQINPALVQPDQTKAKKVFPLEQAQELQKQGKNPFQIAKILRWNEGAVRKYLALGCIPVHGNTGLVKRSSYDRFRASIEKYLAEHQHIQISKLHRALQAEGFTGCASGLRKYVVSRYPEVNGRRQLIGKTTRPVSRYQTVSYRSLVWLMLNFSKRLTEDQQQFLKVIEQDFPALWEVRELTRWGLDAFRQRDLPEFLKWTRAVLESDHRELKRYLEGLKRDWEGVLNCFEYPYSNGPVEGHVNRLKYIKRQMYGRAKFDLLRLKVLYHQ